MRVYFLGIAGTAMGNAALLLRSLGHEVLGVDSNVYPPMSDVLREAGIAWREGYDADLLARSGADLVVVGNVASRGNPEVEWLLQERRVDYDSLPAVLRKTVLAGRQSIVVAGTHGKTTTTALTAHLLRENGYDPGFLIGGVPLDPPIGTHLGDQAHPFVIEGDEYDSAFFDKRSKFIHYQPHIAILNNLEFDHADIFRDLADVERTFSHFVRLVPGNGAIVINGDDPNLEALMPIPWTTILRAGVSPGNDLRISGFSESGEQSQFELVWKEQPWASVRWNQSGLYNARNAAMAALAAGLWVSPEDPTRLDLTGLTSFRGVKRRQEVRLRTQSLTVLEDFGHHPTAIGATLESLRNRHTGTRLVAAFEPRSNTARTKIFQKALVPALAWADRVIIAPVEGVDRLKPDQRLDVRLLGKSLVAAGSRANACSGMEECLELLVEEARGDHGQPTLIVFFSNGSFGGLISRLVETVGPGTV